MQPILVWKMRAQKFLDNPIALIPFLQKHLYFRWVSDSYIQEYKNVQFLNYEETLEEILINNRSIVRFGDELFDMLLGIGLYFNGWRQKYHPDLAKRLKEVISTTDDRLLICFNPELIFKTKKEMSLLGIEDQHQFWTNSRVYLRRYIQPSRVYGSALSFHERYNTKLPYQKIISHLQGKHLIIVTSNTARFAGKTIGLTTEYVEGPASDAWEEYDSLLARVLELAGKFPREKVLIMSSLGSASKVMVYDLTKSGYVAWDTGQFFDFAISKLVS